MLAQTVFCNRLTVQDKSYSRDWLVRGRIRVELKNTQGKPIVPDIPTRKSKLTRAAYNWHIDVAQVVA